MLVFVPAHLVQVVWTWNTHTQLELGSDNAISQSDLNTQNNLSLEFTENGWKTICVLNLRVIYSFLCLSLKMVDDFIMLSRKKNI